jgi:hypothetical protein
MTALVAREDDVDPDNLENLDGARREVFDQ